MKRLATSVVLTLVGAAFACAQDPAAWTRLSRQTKILLDRGEYPKALENAKSSLEQAEKFGSRDMRVAMSWNSIGLAEMQMGRLAYAESALIKARDLLLQTPAMSRGYGAVLDNLATLYEKLGDRPRDVEALRRQGLMASEKHVGADNAQLITPLGNLASACLVNGKKREAQKYLERALDLAQRHQARPHDVAFLESNYASFEALSGDDAAALQHAERAISLLESAVTPDHPDLLIPLMNLGTIYQRLGRMDAAKQRYERALRLADILYGPEDPRLAVILEAHAIALRMSGDKREAAKVEKRVKSIRSGDMQAALVNASINVHDLRKEYKQ